MKYAVIKDGVVINLARSFKALDENWIPFEEGVDIGDLYHKGTFSKPDLSGVPEPVPDLMPMHQFRFALIKANLAKQVDEAFALLTGEEGDAIRTEWEYSIEVKRASPLVQAIQVQLNLTDEQVDNLFRTAEVTKEWSYDQAYIIAVKAPILEEK